MAVRRQRGVRRRIPGRDVNREAPAQPCHRTQRTLPPCHTAQRSASPEIKRSPSSFSRSRSGSADTSVTVPDEADRPAGPYTCLRNPSIAELRRAVRIERFGERVHKALTRAMELSDQRAIQWASELREAYIALLVAEDNTDDGISPTPESGANMEDAEDDEADPKAAVKVEDTDDDRRATAMYQGLLRPGYRRPIASSTWVMMQSNEQPEGSIYGYTDATGSEPAQG